MTQEEKSPRARRAHRRSPLAVAIYEVLARYGIGEVPYENRIEGTKRVFRFGLNYNGRMLPPTADLDALAAAGGVEVIVKSHLEGLGYTVHSARMAAGTNRRICMLLVSVPRDCELPALPDANG